MLDIYKCWMKGEDGNENKMKEWVNLETKQED